LNALGIKAKGYQSNAADFNEAQTLVDSFSWIWNCSNKQCRNYKDNLLMRMSEEDFDQCYG
jgi:3-oxoacyl-[acyl-carrier protein] reductase